MNKNFEILAEELRNRGLDAELMEVAKTNAVKTAICIKRDGHGINIYEDMFPNMDAPVSELADTVEERLDSWFQNAPDVSVISDPDYIRNHLEVRICKDSWNKEKLADAVMHRVFNTDLVQYLVLTIELPDGHTGTATVTEKILEASGVSMLDAWYYGVTAKEPSVQDLRSVMVEYARRQGVNDFDIPGFFGSQMAIISNKERYYGASAMMHQKALDEARRMLGSNEILIIPSSVHEVLAVPAATMETTELEWMVNDVNSSLVKESERLSDHPYLWDGVELKSVGTQKEGVQ